MSSQERIKAFAISAVSLQSTNGAEWNRFMQLLAARIDEVTENMVNSSPEQLQKFQGAAQEIRALFKELHDAPRLVEAMRKKEQNSGTAPNP